MQKKSFIVLGVIVAVLILAILVYMLSMKEDTTSMNAEGNDQSEEMNITTEEGMTEMVETTAVFTNPASGEEVTVVFDQKNDTATLTGLSYDGLVLHIARSASGARYVNETESLELWNRGDAVRISEGGEEVFMGNIGGETDREILTANTWTWLATRTSGEVIEPKQADAFTISFNVEEGTMKGATDCNAIFGPYTIGEENSLSFGALAMTKKYCEGSQEQVFAEGLSQVTVFYFSGSGQLVFEFATSTGSMLFSR